MLITKCQVMKDMVPCLSCPFPHADLDCFFAFDTVGLFVPPIVSASWKIKREFTSALQSRGTAAGPGIVRGAARVGIYSFAIRQSSCSKAGACSFKKSNKPSQMLPLTLSN